VDERVLVVKSVILNRLDRIIEIVNEAKEVLNREVSVENITELAKKIDSIKSRVDECVFQMGILFSVVTNKLVYDD